MIATAWRRDARILAGLVGACTHLLCELIGGDCSLAINRSRGCRPGVWTRTVSSEVFDEVRALLAVIDPSARAQGVRAAAVRLAQIVRAEALENRNLLAHARDDDPELAELLAPLVMRGSQPQPA
jgi:hypothetical protein